ncbi:50S ribosomal protein L4, partial [Bacteroidia bacterium]|nr:50S ribosomal protein L4 [Bacteroidia bacterium]
EREILDCLRKAVIDLKIVPMMCGSAFKNKGVQTMLDMVMELMPSPLDVEDIQGTHPDTEEPITRKPSYDEPFSALAFKIATDPFVGRLCFIRAYSGKLDAGSYVKNMRTGNKERISRIFQMHANKQNSIEFLGAGDIGAAVGFKDIKTGDTLCDEKNLIVLESMVFPDPVIGLAIEPKTQADTDKLGMALAKLAEEDPTFKVHTDDETGQTVISGMGELHLDIIVDRLKREFKVECNQGAPQVNYKEAITRNNTHRETYKKQTGGRGKFADIQFEIGPADEDWKGEGLQFVNEIVGGSIPKEYIPSVEKGFKAAMQNGILAGYTIDRMKVRLFDGSFHPVDSDSLSFEVAAKQGFRVAAKSCGPILLEPIMKLEVVTPDENTGDVMGDLNRRRGQMEGMDERAGAQVVKAKVPLSEMFGYVTSLRTITSGRANSTMEFSHYAETRKIYRQKGTGNARHGSLKSGIFVGGARIHGPRPRDYSFKLNKKLKRVARLSALSYKAKDKSVMVMEDFSMDAPKTSDFKNMLNALNLTGRTLFVTPENDKNIYLSGRNIPKNTVMAAADLNTYQVLKAKSLILTEGALNKLQESLQK